MITVLVLLDQLSKIYATALLKGKEDIILIKGVLQLHYLENTGAAFSSFAGKTWIFLVLTPLICIGLVWVLYRVAGSRRMLSLYLMDVMLLSGAIGNFLDRIHHQYVVDFIYVSLINFPVFNVADIYVTVSVAVICILVIFVYKEEDLKL